MHPQQVLWIRTVLMRIRLWTKVFYYKKLLLLLNIIHIFYQKLTFIYTRPPRRTPKASNTMKQCIALHHCFLFFWVIFAHLGPDPDPKSIGNRIRCPQHCVLCDLQQHKMLG
jgi:hypothetical protein